MGIRTVANPTGDKTFTEDRLKIEICGPEEDYLTVIDVPGIFRATIDGVTTIMDRDLVRNMVKEYIRDSRTIILAVLPCNVDIATQEILQLAKELDKSGERTLGILTKPDQVHERSLKAAVCNLVQDRKNPLTLGYFVVRNRGGDDEGQMGNDLAERERMFQDDPWRELPRKRVGVVALRERLQELLGQITDRAFPQLRTEVRAMLAKREQSLEALGPPRQSVREQQLYLTEIATRFRNLVRRALDADYSVHPALEKDELRLITAVVNLTERWNHIFERYSHLYRFEAVKDDDIWVSTKPSVNCATNVVTWWNIMGSDKHDVTKEHDTDSWYRPKKFPELEDLLVGDMTCEIPKDGIMSWIADMYRRSRGIELGTFGPAMLASAFREQSQKWDSLTVQYLSVVIFVIHRFIHEALKVVCVDPRVREELLSTMQHEMLVRYRAGLDQAKLLVTVEREKRPYTLNNYFNTNLQEARGVRMASALASQVRVENSRSVVDFGDIASAATNMSNAEHAKQDIHDMLDAYYTVARKRFVDNVFHQAVDHCLLSGPSSPLAIFTERWVVELDPEKLAAIAGEPWSVRDQREKLNKTIEDLKGAIEILR